MNYPKRDPSLKNNWRGRSRVIDVDDQNITVFEQAPQNVGEEDDVEQEWNYQALRNAMNKGMSFWRSHTNRKLFENPYCWIYHLVKASHFGNLNIPLTLKCQDFNCFWLLWVSKLLQAPFLRLEDYKKVKFPGRDNSFLAVKGLN